MARYCRARAGFGGLELSTRLSEQFGQDIDIVLIDQSEGFIFGFSKLDVMFGRKPASDVLHPYRDIDKPGLRFVQTTIRAIDPASKRVETDSGAFEGDIMVVALGADLDPERKVAVLSEGPAMPYDLFLGVPAHRVPAVVEESGMTVDGWIPVNPLTLETAFPDVYAVGDVTSVGTPKAGVFSEGQAAVVAPHRSGLLRDRPRRSPPTRMHSAPAASNVGSPESPDRRPVHAHDDSPTLTAAVHLKRKGGPLWHSASISRT